MILFLSPVRLQSAGMILMLAMSSCGEKRPAATAPVFDTNEVDSAGTVSRIFIDEVKRPDSIVPHDNFLVVYDPEVKYEVVKKGQKPRMGYKDIAFSDGSVTVMSDGFLHTYRQFIPKFNFDDLEAEVYKGWLAEPDFERRSYSNDSKPILEEACKTKGINFAGNYTIVEMSCGAMCSGMYIIDRRNGRIYDDLPVNNGGRYGFEYRADSRLLIANSAILEYALEGYEGFYNMMFGVPELYEWKNDKLIRVQ